ncbi:hypothetical protein GCM10027605_63220 [Micromonospora zhanjiangensis]
MAAEKPQRRAPTRGPPMGASRDHTRRKTMRRGAVTDKAQTYNGYCVKCKEKRDFEGNVEVSKTGMNMAKGKCPVCGTTVNRILGKAKV